ncbi:Clavaminate synthase-like protein [Aspergillus egyptiacus]|nr:Clavaminate synthase-like protein [Aspergillus egyptiacus]
MGSIAESDGPRAETPRLPSVSYLDLQHQDGGIRDPAANAFAQALKDYGACRIREHGIPQERIDMCFDKCGRFFQRPLEEKIADQAVSGAGRMARFVPYGSEKTRGEEHQEEVLQLRDGIFHADKQVGNWSVEVKDLISTSEYLHDRCHLIHQTLLDCLSLTLDLPRSLTGIHSKENTFFAPTYFAPCNSHHDDTHRVPLHVDPTTMLFNFADTHGGLMIADLRKENGSLYPPALRDTVDFIPAECQAGEFVVVAGNLLRKLVMGVKHAVHYVQRPVGSSGFHLNYWTVPDMDVSCGSGQRQETVGAYLQRVFPSTFGPS